LIRRIGKNRKNAMITKARKRRQTQTCRHYGLNSSVTEKRQVAKNVDGKMRKGTLKRGKKEASPRVESERWKRDFWKGRANHGDGGRKRKKI